MKFYILKTNRRHRKWKGSDKSDIWPPCSLQKMRWDIWKIFISDFESNFPLLGGVFPKCSKSKYDFIYNNNKKLTPVVSGKNTPFTLFAFSPLFSCLFLSKFQNFIFFLILGELRELHAKFHMCWMKIKREMICQSLPLFYCFYTNVTNFPIVHC